MDAPRGAGICRALILLAYLCITLGLLSHAQSQVPQEPSTKSTLYSLLQQKRWEEVVRMVEAIPTRRPDDELALGFALANLRRLEEAKQAFLRGSHAKPRDPRFYIELGGLAFKQGHYEVATAWLLKAERLSPGDAYVNEFLGTVMYLGHNLEAALKYWNRVGKPEIENVRIEPPLQVDPVILDRAFAFSAGSVLTLDQWLTTEKRLRGMEIFQSFSIEVVARNDGRYDVVLHANERNGFGKGLPEILLSTFGGVIYQTATPAYYNLGGSATNMTSLWRWDTEKRRIAANVSGPLRRDPKWRYSIGLDLRNENWNIRNFSSLNVAGLGTLNMRRSTGFARIASFRSGRWNWSTGAEWSYRDFRSVAFAPDLVADGHELKHTAEVNYELLRAPQHRFLATVSASSELGRFWGGQGATFEKLQARLQQKWTAAAAGDDLVFLHSVRIGRTFGEVPFDELFMLGHERDNDLPMRAHIGTRVGQKGNAPLGRRYFLSNWEFDKNIWRQGLVVKAGPFVDTGKVTDPLSYLGTRKWLWDAGGQLKVRLLGVQVGMTYGRDLRAGKDAFYVWVRK